MTVYNTTNQNTRQHVITQHNTALNIARHTEHNTAHGTTQSSLTAVQFVLACPTIPHAITDSSLIHTAVVVTHELGRLVRTWEGNKQKNIQSLPMKAGTWVEPTSGSQNTWTEQESRNPPVVVRTHELSRKAETHQWKSEHMN